MTKVASSEHHKIVAMYRSGATQLQVGVAFGLSRQRVHQVLRRIGIGRGDRAQLEGGDNYRYVVNPSRRDDMAGMYRAGMTLQAIGDEFGITRERVRQILANRGMSKFDGGSCIKSLLNVDAKVAAERARNEKQEARIRAAWGMSLSDYRAHVAEFGSSRVCTSPMHKFIQQRGNAQARGLVWDFTFSDWWRVWRESGKWDERGRGGYVMARWGDGDTPYSADTVYICTQSQNAKDSFIAVPAAARAAKRAAKT